MLPTNRDTIIRKMIEKILKDDSNAEKWKYDSSKINRENLEQLKKLGIQVKHDSQKFRIKINCFAFGLNLMNSEKYIEYCKDAPSQESGLRSNDILYLLENKYLKELSNPSTGCLILYFNEEGTPKHAAILKEIDYINSKITVESKMG